MKKIICNRQSVTGKPEQYIRNLQPEKILKYKEYIIEFLQAFI